MEGLVSLAVGIALFALAVLLIRLFGAWMLRINEVIKFQKDILHELKSINAKTTNAPINPKTSTTNELGTQETGKENEDANQEVKTEHKPIVPKDYESITIKHIYGGEETVSRKQWEKMKSKFGESNYIVIAYI